MTEEKLTQTFVGRRTLLARISGFIAAFIAMAVGIPLAGYTILPALKRREPKWADVGAVESLKPGVPQGLGLIVSVSDGWQKTTTKKSVWAVKDEAGAITAYSPICPHLGCGYRWEISDRQFRCPCHNSYFSLDGEVLSGPAPRPLDTLPVKIEGGRLLVTYKEFKAGTAAKIEL